MGAEASVWGLCRCAGGLHWTANVELAPHSDALLIPARREVMCWLLLLTVKVVTVLGCDEMLV